MWGKGESVSTRVSPVLLVDCVSTGHITVAMASCPRARLREQGGAGGSFPLGVALSASLPGDFRPVMSSTLMQSAPWPQRLHRCSQGLPWVFTEVALRAALSPVLAAAAEDGHLM